MPHQGNALLNGFNGHALDQARNLEISLIIPSYVFSKQHGSDLLHGIQVQGALLSRLASNEMHHEGFDELLEQGDGLRR